MCIYFGTYAIIAFDRLRITGILYKHVDMVHGSVFVSCIQAIHVPSYIDLFMLKRLIGIVSTEAHIICIHNTRCRRRLFAHLVTRDPFIQ